MHSKTQWLIRVGAVSLTLAISVAPLTAQGIDIPVTSFSFAPEQRDAARALLESGTDCFDKGKFSDAEKKFREVVQKHKSHAVADKADYYLIRTLVRQNKFQDAIAEISLFEKEFPRSSWLSDVREVRVTLTKQIPPELQQRFGFPAPAVPFPPQSPQPPQSPPAPQAPSAATTPGRVSGIGIGFGRTSRTDENPEVTLQREVLRVLFENSADRAIEIATDRLKADPSDPVVLSSLYMLAQSRSDKALPLLVTLAKTSPDSRTRREALNWIGRSRGDKDALADVLVGLVPFMTTDEDSAAVAFSLGQMNNAKAFDALASMARDKNKSEKLRMNAIQAIGDARLTNRVAMLDEIYKANMDNVRIRRTVVNYLTHAKDPQVVDVLARIAQNDPDLTVRREAVNYLGQVKSPEALKALEALLNKKPQ